MTINEAKQAAYSAANAARSQADALLKNHQHTKEDAIELMNTAHRLSVAATELADLTGKPAEPPINKTKKKK